MFNIICTNDTKSPHLQQIWSLLETGEWQKSWHIPFALWAQLSFLEGYWTESLEVFLFSLASLFRKQEYNSSRLGALSTFNSSNYLIICSRAIMKPPYWACFLGSAHCCISWMYSSLFCNKGTENLPEMMAFGCHIAFCFWEK